MERKTLTITFKLIAREDELLPTGSSLAATLSSDLPEDLWDGDDRGAIGQWWIDDISGEPASIQSGAKPEAFMDTSRVPSDLRAIAALARQHVDKCREIGAPRSADLWRNLSVRLEAAACGWGGISEPFRAD